VIYGIGASRWQAAEPSSWSEFRANDCGVFGLPLVPDELFTLGGRRADRPACCVRTGAAARRPRLRDRRRGREGGSVRPASAGSARGTRQSAVGRRVQVPAARGTDGRPRHLGSSVGRTGRADARRPSSSPLPLGGVTITNISLHNRQDLERMDVRVGDTVMVVRRGRRHFRTSRRCCTSCGRKARDAARVAGPLSPSAARASMRPPTSRSATARNLAWPEPGEGTPRAFRFAPGRWTSRVSARSSSRSSSRRAA